MNTKHTQKSKKLLVLAIKGAQGSGKGNQAELFEKTLRGREYVPRILTMSKILEKTGDRKVRELMDRGRPVPCAILKDLFEAAARAAVDDGCDALIGDGYPRYTPGQVDDFASIVRGLDSHTIIVRIRATRDLCVSRIVGRAQEMRAAGKEPRADDLDPEAVKTRLDHYFATEPIVTRRLFDHHQFPYVHATANPEVTKDELHQKLVRQIWPDAPRPTNNFVGAAPGHARQPLAAA